MSGRSPEISRGGGDADRDEGVFRTDSGLDVESVYAAPNSDPEASRTLGQPGAFPFTRGIYPSMYRERLWTMRQYAGFGTARETNARYRYLLERGQTGLSVAFDLPTQMGFDSDDPRASGEVGRSGVAIDSLVDMRVLFEGIDLGSVSTSMTINATAAILLAMYFVVAEEHGVQADALSGTLQNDILKEYIARGTYIFPTEPSLRLVTDVIAFCVESAPRWNPISISGYHIREAGATAPQELAFTFANGLEYIDRAVGAGLGLREFAPRLSFFFAAHNDLFEEVAKFRAARRLWASLMKERYDAPDAACRLRFHTQTGGSTLTAQQPLNNIVRVTIQALSAALGGTQSLHTNGFDEALNLPSEEAARVALRTQQILAHESGITRTVDPLAGSYFVEALTDRIEMEAREYLGEVAERGGAARSLAYMRDQIHRAAYQFQVEIESGDRVLVGVNRFQETGEVAPGLSRPGYGALEAAQRQALGKVRGARSELEVKAALDGLATAARGDDDLMSPIMNAVRSMSTLGEISNTLRGEWGSFVPQA